MTIRKVEVMSTKALIDSAFKQLLIEKDYENITVLDISMKANINRATFYLHFKDKRELFTLYNEQFFNQLEILLSNILSSRYLGHSLKKYVETPFPPLVALFSYMKRELILSNCLLGMKSVRENGLHLEKLLEKYYVAFYRKHRPPQLFDQDQDAQEYYMLKASIGLIYGWIDEGMRQSADEMAILFVQFSLKL